MNLQQALNEFRLLPRHSRTFDTLAEATVEATRLSMHYQGPYCLTCKIFPLDDDKYVTLATWYDLGD